MGIFSGPSHRAVMNSFALWKEADPVIPIYIAAKAE